jgi:hypothetical protein
VLENEHLVGAVLEEVLGVLRDVLADDHRAQLFTEFRGQVLGDAEEFESRRHHFAVADFGENPDVLVGRRFDRDSENVLFVGHD